MSIHPAALSEDELLAACDFHATRRSGPGGQHRNKVETAVVLTHRATGLRAEASERRSQAQNRSMAMQRLRVELAIQIRQPVSAEETPSELWQTRTKGRKLQVSNDHQDFPALLAEALDRVTVHQFDLSSTAVALGVSTTQLVRFLQQAPVAWQTVNAERVARNLRPLR